MYIVGLMIPVPQAQEADYRQWAEHSAALLRRYGCLEIVESWEDSIPEGRQTDMRRAVAAEPHEKVVFAWQVWPDKATLEAAESQMHADGAFEVEGEIPFDQRRLIYGCFTPIHRAGRD